jgi:hypothetical protein
VRAGFADLLAPAEPGPTAGDDECSTVEQILYKDCARGRISSGVGSYESGGSIRWIIQLPPRVWNST